MLSWSRMRSSVCWVGFHSIFRSRRDCCWIMSDASTASRGRQPKHNDVSIIRALRVKGKPQSQLWSYCCRESVAVVQNPWEPLPLYYAYTYTDIEELHHEFLRAVNTTLNSRSREQGFSGKMGEALAHFRCMKYISHVPYWLGSDMFAVYGFFVVLPMLNLWVRP